ncbi:hypothetical protein KI387_035560, partial [Taxus chinensis]
MNEVVENTHNSQLQAEVNKIASASKNSSPTKEEVIGLLKAVKDEIDVDYLINSINILLQSRTSNQAAPKELKGEGTISQTINHEGIQWNTFIKSGRTFLTFMKAHLEKINLKADIHSSETRKVVVNILNQVGKIHWVVGGLSVIAYLLKKVEKVSYNQSRCLQLLKYMIDFFSHIKKLNHEIPEEEEKLGKALHIIIEGSIICAAQIQSGIFFSFMKTSLNSETLRGIQSRINQLYPDLILTTITAIKHHQPVVLPLSKPIYPDYAVGINEGEQEIMELLSLATTEESSRAVVIYGLGGIGKSTLATAILAKLNIEDFNYVRVGLHEDPSRDDLKCIQQVILKDGFPNFESGSKILLRDLEEGRDRLTQAFKCDSNKALFLFIDNALRAEDLKELMPTDLRCLPRRSRILVTTRNLGETDIFEESFLPRYPYLVKILSREPAMKILSKDPSNLQNIKAKDVNRILGICNGIPLVLKVVGAHLAKMGYDTEKCTQIFESLENGEEIKEENLTTRLINFVYDHLETPTKEAFLDICCFFNNWSRRHVEYILGAEQVKLLQEAALVTTYLPDHTKNTGRISADEEKLIVHDVVRVKGVSMSKSTRIIDVQSLIEAAEDEKKLMKIKGVWLAHDKTEYIVEERHLNAMRNSLRVLSLGDCMKFSGQIHLKFKELRYLRICGDIAFLHMNLQALQKLAAHEAPISQQNFHLLDK